MVVVALLDATLRERLAAPAGGGHRPRVLGTATLLVALAVLVAVYLPRVPEHTPEGLRVSGSSGPG